MESKEGRELDGENDTMGQGEGEVIFMGSWENTVVMREGVKKGGQVANFTVSGTNGHAGNVVLKTEGLGGRGAGLSLLLKRFVCKQHDSIKHLMGKVLCPNLEHPLAVWN